MRPDEIISALHQAGLTRILQLALERYRRDGKLGRSQAELSSPELQALKRLTGQTSHQLDLALLNQALRTSRYQIGLVELLEFIHGAHIIPIGQQRKTWSQIWATLLTEVPHLAWKAALEQGEAGAHLLKQFVREGHEVTSMVHTTSQALQMLGAKPWRNTMLAAHLTGNAHALDADQPLGKLLQAAAEALGITPPLRDGVSSTVLCANLLGVDWLEAAPARALSLTWREVNTLQSIQAIHNRIWIVENPSVFEGLLERLQTSTTLLCTSGQPSAAAWVLLDRLEPQTELWVHCDFDLGGLRIAGSLQQRYPNQFHPWRFDRANYLAVLERTPGLPLSQTLPGERFGDLVEAMRVYAKAVHQEVLLDQLLMDIQHWL